MARTKSEQCAAIPTTSTMGVFVNSIGNNTFAAVLPANKADFKNASLKQKNLISI